jgi:hypothetical protein
MHGRVAGSIVLAITFCGGFFGVAVSAAEDAAREAEIQQGSETAKGGFQNEEDVCAAFNHWQTDADARAWLTIMRGSMDGIESVMATLPRGEKAKTDVEVRVTTAAGEKRYGISIKLVSTAGGFNQIDRRWVKTYAAMWNMPPEVEDALKLFVGEAPPTQGSRDPDRMFLTELPPETQANVIDFFTRHRDRIVSDLVAGDGDHAAGWLLVTARSHDDGGVAPAPKRSVLVSTKEAAAFFGTGDVTITPRGSLRIGRITMQRKGGDNGRDTATMLQFKIDPTDLFEREESGSLDPVSRQVAEPHPNSTEHGDGTGN